MKRPSLLCGEGERGIKMPAIDITGLCLPLKPQKEKVDMRNVLIKQKHIQLLPAAALFRNCRL
jgi:hypothetical protein